MSRDSDDSWDSYLDDEFDSVDRGHWDEEDWEQFLLRQDVLNAKYQELYETLRDHPNRDAIIAREMRWHPSSDDAFLAPPDDDDDDDDLLDDEEWMAREEAFVADLETIPAYCLALDLADRVEHCLAARLGDRGSADDDGAQALRAVHEISSHVASGHSIGYERDTLCGNIACCRRAQRSLAECFDGLVSLRRRGILSPRETDAFLALGREASDAIARRIDELRRRVWWC